MKLRVLFNAPASFSNRYKTCISKAIQQTVSQIPAKNKQRLKSFGKSTVSVKIATPKEISGLNSKYRKKNKVTDVLSFSRVETDLMAGAPEFDLGDLIICLAVAKEQAKRYEQSLSRELERLSVHGTLHLFGYDHEKSPREEKKMFRLQDKILRKLSHNHLKT